MGSRTQTTYINAIEDFRSRYPDLYRLSYYVQKPDCDGILGRAAVLQFGPGTIVSVEEFKDVHHLKKYSSQVPKSACKHRLYLLEDLSRPFIEAFGAHFWIDPFLFAAQKNSTHWTGSRHSYTLSRRLSPSEGCDPLFTLRYYEIRVPRGGFRPGRLKTLSNVDRKIEPGDYYFEKKEDSRPSVYVIRRNASFWSRTMKDGGWDG